MCVDGKIVCMFATLKVFDVEVTKVAPRRVPGFFYARMQTMICGVQPRAYVVMTYASLYKKTFSSGKWAPFFLSTC
jgi:hypothetical protein